MKSPLHSIIPFLPFLLNHLRLPSPGLGPILIVAARDPRYIVSGRTQRITELPNNSSLVTCIYVPAGMCLNEQLPSNGRLL
jgi:hypothetical protein